MSAQARTELLLLVVLAPLAWTDLRAAPLTRIFATDASLTGAGVCQAEFSAAATLELLRHADRVGFHTKLDTSLRGFLDEWGVRDPSAHFIKNEIFGMTPSRPLAEGILWDVVEVFKGMGNWSWAHQQLGLTAHEGFDKEAQGAAGDLLGPSLFSSLVGLILRRVVRCWHFAPPCKLFGVLRRPRVRSHDEPFGFDSGDQETFESWQLAFRCAILLFLVDWCSQLGSLEQPSGAVMKYLQIFCRLLSRFAWTKFPFCNFGVPFLRLCNWLSNNPRLRNMEARCTCGRKDKHMRAKGTFTRSRLEEFAARCSRPLDELYGVTPKPGSWCSTFAGAYPRPVALQIAKHNVECLETREDDPVLRTGSNPQNGSWTSFVRRMFRLS